LVQHPLTRFALDDAEPVIGRAFARPVGIARSKSTSPRWGEVKLDPGQVDSIKDHFSFRHLPLVVDDDFLAPVRANTDQEKAARHLLRRAADDWRHIAVPADAELSSAIDFK
jgi:hypothetical protein